MQVAQGTIQIDLNDASALAGMRRSEAEFTAAMKRMDGQRAEAHIGADLRELKRDLAAAKAELAAFDRQHNAELKRQRQIEKDNNGIVAKNARERIRALEEERKVIETKLRNIKKTSDEYSYQLDNLKKINRQQNDLNRQALARNKHEERTTGELERQEILVRKLQRRYMEAGREFRRLSTKNTPLGRDARIKLELDTKDALAEMAATEAALNAMGEKPIKQEVRLDQKFMLRQMEEAKQLGARTVDKLSNLGDVAVRFGPFTASIRQLALAMSMLGPMIVDTAGGLTAFAGVLSTGIVGTVATGGAALMGFGMAALGVGAALKPVIADFKVANTASQAWSKASLKYGANSKQAKKAQEQFNSTLQNMDPVSRQAFQNMGKLRNSFDKATQGVARKNFGSVLNEAMKTGNKLMPDFAKNTNAATTNIATGLKNMLRGMGGKEGQGIIGGIFGNFNKMLPGIMSGLGQFGAAIGRIGLSASRNLPAVGRSFDAIMQKFAGSTANSGKLNASIDRMFHHSQDVFRLFGSGGKLLGTVLNGGANAGDRMTKSLTKTFDGWRSFLQTTQGQEKMSGFFDRSVEGFKQIGRALAPLSAAFVNLSTGLSPAFANLAEGFADVMNIVRELTSMIGAGGVLTTLPAVIGAAFAVGKLGSFVAMLARAVSLFRQMATAGKAAAAASGLAAGLDAAAGAFGAGGGLTQIVGSRRAREQAALTREMRLANEAAREGALATKVLTIAAAADGVVMAKQAGMFTRVAAGAKGLSAMLLYAGTAATTSVAAFGGYAAAVTAGTYVTMRGQQAAKGYGQELANAAGATGTFGKAVATGTDQVVRSNPILTMWAGALDIIGIHAGKVEPKIKAIGGGFAAWAAQQQQVNQKIAEFKQAPAVFSQTTNAITGLSLQQQQASITLAQAKQQLAGTTKGTLEYKQALLNVRTAAAQSLLADQQWASAKQQLLSSINKEIAANKIASAADPTGAVRAASAQRLNQLYNQRAAIISNISRAEVGLTALTGKAAQQVGALARTAGGSKLAQTISLTYKAPTNAGAVAAAAKAALGRGAKQDVIIRIIANAKSVEDAIRRINALKPKSKTWNLFANDKASSKAHGAGKAIASVVGKTVDVKANDKASAKSHAAGRAIQSVRGKSVDIRVSSNAQSAAGAAISAIASVHGKSVSINVGLTGRGASLFAKGGIALAAGGIAAAASGSKWKRKRGNFRTRGRYASALIRGADGADMTMLERTQERAAERARGKAAVPNKGSVYRTPTLLVGEENRPEFVIATNPAYRERNQKLVRLAADAVGVATAATGTAMKGPPRGAPIPKPKKGQRVTPKSPVQTRAKYGGIPTALADRTYDGAKHDYDKAKAEFDKQDGIAKNKDKSSAVRKKAREDANKAKERMASAKKRVEKWASVKARLATWNTKLDAYDTAIGIQETIMTQARTKKTWDSAKENKKVLVNKARTLLAIARGLVTGNDPTSRYYSNELLSRYLGLGDTQQADVNRQWSGVVPGNEMTLEQYLRSLGNPTQPSSAAFKWSRLLVRAARATTTADTADDKQVGAEQAALLAGLEPGLIRSRPDDIALQTEFYGALSSARQAAGLLEDPNAAAAPDATASTPDVSADTQAQLDQANRKLSVARTSQRIAEAFATVAGRGGDMGFGGYSGRNAAGASPNGPYGGGGPTFIINTLHPGDPATLTAIGDAATSGMGYQGYISNPRLTTGL